MVKITVKWCQMVPNDGEMAVKFDEMAFVDLELDGKLKSDVVRGFRFSPTSGRDRTKRQ